MTDAATTDAPLWEQQPGEPAKWYERFSRYRLAGPGRSLRAVYAAERAALSGGEQRRGSGSVPGSWDQAAGRWQWAERAAAWDAHELDRRRAADEQQYRAQLDRHRDSALRAAQAQIALGTKMLAAVQHAAQKFLDSKKEIAPKDAAAWARAGAVLLDAGLSAQAHTLQLDRLLSELDQGGGDGPDTEQ